MSKTITHSQFDLENIKKNDKRFVSDKELTACSQYTYRIVLISIFIRISLQNNLIGVSNGRKMLDTLFRY